MTELRGLGTLRIPSPRCPPDLYALESGHGRAPLISETEIGRQGLRTMVLIEQSKMRCFIFAAEPSGDLESSLAHFSYRRLIARVPGSIEIVSTMGAGAAWMPNEEMNRPSASLESCCKSGARCIATSSLCRCEPFLDSGVISHRAPIPRKVQSEEAYSPRRRASKRERDDRLKTHPGREHGRYLRTEKIR